MLKIGIVVIIGLILIGLAGYFLVKHLRKELHWEAQQVLNRGGDIHYHMNFVPAGENSRFFRLRTVLTEYAYGLFPLFVFRNEEVIFSFAHDVFRHIRTYGYELATIVRESPSAMWKQIAKDVTRHLSLGISQIMQDAKDAILPEYEKFHGKFLDGILKNTRNALRKNVIETIQSWSSQKLEDILQGHLHSFIAKVQEHALDHQTSGSAALPTNTKFVYRSRNASIFVIETIPQIRTINYLGRTYQLAFPYIVFVVTLISGEVSSLQTFFRKTRLRSERDELGVPALSNIDGSFVVCFPAPINNATRNESEMVEEAIHNFWGSNFNNDHAGWMRSAQSKFSSLKSFSEWQRRSLKDPLFILKLDWESADTVKRVVKDRLNRIDGRHGLGNEDLFPYVSETSNRFAKQMAEELLFAVQNKDFAFNDMAFAKQELARLLEGPTTKIKERLDALLGNEASVKEYLPAVAERLQTLLADKITSAVEEPIRAIVQKLEQF